MSPKTFGLLLLYVHDRSLRAGYVRTGELTRASIAPQRGASLPNPDPTAGSPSARLVEDFAPYMVATYARPPPVFVRGQGSYLWDIEDRKYLDFTAGIAVNALGHCDPEFTELLYEQV